jgi:hypothetical protein
MKDITIIQKEVSEYTSNSWDLKKQRCKEYIEHFEAKSKIKIISNKNVYQLHVPIGDNHLGNDGTDMETMEYHAKLCGSNENILAYNTGDSIDNFIKTSIIGALINQTSTPKEQIKLLQQYIEFFNGQLLLMIGGNHDRWTKQISGLDWLTPFTKSNEIVYSPDVFNINYQVNGIDYYFKFRHKYRFNSSYNPTHAVKQMLRFSDHVFDVGCVAHNHEPAIEQLFMFNNPVIMIRCGSYKICDTFSREHGFNQSHAILPCFITSPIEKKLIAFWDIEEAIFYLNKKNEELVNDRGDAKND